MENLTIGVFIWYLCSLGVVVYLLAIIVTSKDIRGEADLKTHSLPVKLNM